MSDTEEYAIFECMYADSEEYDDLGEVRDSRANSVNEVDICSSGEELPNVTRQSAATDTHLSVDADADAEPATDNDDEWPLSDSSEDPALEVDTSSNGEELLLLSDATGQSAGAHRAARPVMCSVVCTRPREAYLRLAGTAGGQEHACVHARGAN